MKLGRHHPNEIRVCSIVRAELSFGAYRSSRPAENLRILEKFLAPYESLPFDDPCGDIYGRIRADLAALGTPIGPNDLMIAAIAIKNDLTLVSANTREFGRVAGLSIENWETEAASKKRGSLRARKD
jgi:tRNA(fMet)-specific endonuclease VapC